MNDPRKIILRPVVTEKSTTLTERVNRKGVPQNAYSFRVARGATKIQIREAIEALFRVRVRAVNIIWRRGKLRRTRKGGSTRLSDWKKAIVTLQEGHKIEMF